MFTAQAKLLELLLPMVILIVSEKQCVSHLDSKSVYGACE